MDEKRRKSPAISRLPPARSSFHTVWVDTIYVLKRPFDPWVEVHGSDTILRSKTLDSLGSVHEVRDYAIGMISRINGAVALSQGARPVSFGGVVEFTSDGRLHRTVFAEVMSLEGRDKMRVSGEVWALTGNR